MIFLTKRPETVGVIAQVQSQRWLVDSAEAREQPGVMNRVLRLLGLKEPAGV